MHYALLLIMGISMPELIGTYPSLDICLYEAKKYEQDGAVCLEVELMTREFNK